MIIPSDFLSVKDKKGLYYKNHSFTVNGVTIVSRDLRADDQHCFYDNTLPEEERIYMEQITTKPEWTSNFTCILREEGIKIGEKTEKPEIA